MPAQRSRLPSAAVGTAFVAAMVGGLPAVAEQGIEEVVVSASRIGAVDQRVVVLDEEDVDAASFFGPEPLRFLPGLALSAAGSRGSLTQARVRGAEANHLLVLIDGVAANDPALGSEFNFGALDLAGIRRVEFLAGPQSAVWGSDALAGVLHLDTTPRRDGQWLSLGYGTQGTVDADASLARVGDNGYGALSLAHVASDGTNTSLTGSEDDGFANATAHLRTGVEAGSWQLSFSTRWTDAEADFDPTPAPSYLPADGDRGGETRTALLAADARFTGYRRFQPRLTLARVWTRNRNRADGWFTDGSVGHRHTATLSGNFLFDAQRANLVLEVETERFAQSGSASPFGDPNQRQRTTTRSIAGEYQRELARLALSASVRGDFNDEYEDAVCYRLGATAGGNPRWFASLGRGVKNPTFTERFGFTPDTFLGNPNLEPETSTGFEAGLERTWRGRWGEATLSLVYFNTTLHDEIDGFAFDVEQGGFTARNIDRRSKRRGAETTLEARLGGIRVRGAYAYVDSKSGAERELRRPRHLASLMARGQLAPWLSAGIGMTHTGMSLDRNFSTLPASPIELDGFRLLRLHADIAPMRRWQLRLLVENALDADYATAFGYRSPGLAAMAKIVVEL